MRTAILAAFAALMLGLSAAYADPPGEMIQNKTDSQYNWTAGGAGWG